MEAVNKSQERTYKYMESCVFRKTKELFGGLSNMASGFPLSVNGIYVLTSEALYQACRFPHLPDIQKKIIGEKSPMSAKMVGKPFRSDSRPDWDSVRNEIMYWCLRVKLAQNFISFGQLLASTESKPIVEDSNKDKYWGAVKDKEDESILVGVNALGRLLMKLRKEYYSENRLDLLYVEPLNLPNFLLYHNPIQVVDERQKFLDILHRTWRIPQQTTKQTESKSHNGISHEVSQTNIVHEPEVNHDTGNNKETNQKPKQKSEPKSKPKTPLATSGDLFTNI
ncbi:MAG: NADAR family protein [Bacteroidota bacterium]